MIHPFIHKYVFIIRLYKIIYSIFVVRPVTLSVFPYSSSYYCHYNQDMVVPAAITAIVLEFMHTIIKFSMYSITIFRSVPPGILFRTANLAEINSIGRPV